MTRRASAAAVLAVAVLSGCTTTVTGVAKPAASSGAGASSSGPPTEVSTGDPTYEGPPSDAPDSLGPLTSVLPVDLTPVLPGVEGVWAEGAVVGAFDRTYVALRDGDYTTYRLATVTPEGAVLRSVQIPLMDDPDLFALGDGRVVLAGEFWAADQGGITDERQYGFQVVDPRSGEDLHSFIDPAAGPFEYDYEHAALSPDGETLYLFVSWSPFATDDDPHPADKNQLFAFDLESGKLLAGRDLADDLAAISIFDSGVYASGLVARPDGGATLVFDTTPSAADEEAHLPTLLFFDGDLEPDGDPVRLAGLDEPAKTDAVTGTADGTVFTVLESRKGVSVLATPDGGGSGTQLATLPDAFSGFGLAVEPAQVQSLLYTDSTVQPLDLTTGQVGESLALNCSGQGVRDIFPGGRFSDSEIGALMVGECDTPAPRTQYLWIVTDG